MAISETKRGPPAGGNGNKRAPNSYAASDAIASALRLDDCDAREDDPTCPRGGDGERDPSPPGGRGPAAGRGAGVKKKLKAKAAAAAAASFDCDDRDPAAACAPRDSFGFNLTAAQSLSFDMADGDGGQGGTAEVHHQRGRESAGWAISGGVRELPPRDAAADDRHAGGGIPCGDDVRGGVVPGRPAGDRVEQRGAEHPPRGWST
ncbi:hypothetical protein THAOC_26493, partial [Thalassiosira oceanica]